MMITPPRTEHPLNLAGRILTTAVLATVPIVVAAPAALAHDDVEAAVNVDTDDDGLTIEINLDLCDGGDLIEL
jgi:hypothetical protein